VLRHPETRGNKICDGRVTSTQVCDRGFNRSAASRTFGEDGLWIAEAKLAKSRTICHAVKVPKVLEKDGFVFFFYSNDHAPIHIHVRRGGGEAVFDLDNGVELRESQGMKLSDIAKAEAIATQYKQLMIKKWHEHLD
jgi:hypothetical protein